MPISQLVQKKQLTSVGVLIVAYLFLILSSFLYSSISNPLLGAIIALPIILYISYTLLKKFDLFSFVLIIFICNHFRFYDNLWNFIFLGSLLFFKPDYVFTTKHKGSIFVYLLNALFISNLVGLLLNDTAAFIDIVAGFLLFCSYYLIFYVIINYNFQLDDLKRFGKVVVVLIFFELFVSIFQKLGVFAISLPYLPLMLNYDDLISKMSDYRVVGTLGDFELLAEYSAFLLIFIMCLVLYKKIDQVISRSILFLTAIALFMLVLFTGTRSSLLLIGVATLIILFTHLRVLFLPGIWITLGILYLAFNFMINLGDPLGLSVVFDRISQMDVSDTNSQSSDAIINRDLTFNYAYNRLAERSWIIGDGYTNGESYRRSLFGNVDAEVGNYHSLYLSMPIFFGWVGSIFFILFIVSTLILLFQNMVRSNPGSLSFYISFGFFLAWLLLFINEYKVEFIRFPNYFFLMWFWLSISINISDRLSNVNQMRPKLAP